MDQRTDRPMEGRTNGRTQPLIELWPTNKNLYGKDNIPSHYALTFGIALLKKKNHFEYERMRTDQWTDRLMDRLATC